MSSIFDDITATDLGAFWTEKSKERAPYLWDTLFPAKKQVGSNFEFYRGQSNAPKPLVPSAFGAQAIMRERQDFEKISDKTRYFKEGLQIDEDLRQQLLNLQQNGNSSQKDLIINKIFDDQERLLTGAELTREIVRNQLMQTGKVNIFGNGQHIQADYEMKETHKVVAKNAWGSTGSTPFDDIRAAKNVVGDDSDQTITRVVMNDNTLQSMLRDTNVKSTMLYDNGKLANVTIPQSELFSFLSLNYGLTIQVYDKQYNDIDGTKKYWIPDGRVIFLPEGNLGNTIMSTTPEEADLLGSQAADVSIVDNGVAISTMMTADPVNKKTNVSQQFMPTFEMIDGIYILDTAAVAAPDPIDLNVTPTADGAQVTGK